MKVPMTALRVLWRQMQGAPTTAFQRLPRADPRDNHCVSDQRERIETGPKDAVAVAEAVVVAVAEAVAIAVWKMRKRWERTGGAFRPRRDVPCDFSSTFCKPALTERWRSKRLQ